MMQERKIEYRTLKDTGLRDKVLKLEVPSVLGSYSFSQETAEWDAWHCGCAWTVCHGRVDVFHPSGTFLPHFGLVPVDTNIMPDVIQEEYLIEKVCSTTVRGLQEWSMTS